MIHTRLRQLLAVGLLLGAALTAKADYISLTVKENSGTWTSFGLTGLKVTFSNDKVTVQNREMTQVFPVADLYSLLFTDLPTAIDEANGEVERVMVSLESGRICLKAKAGTEARVYTSSGELCTTARIDRTGTPVVIGKLQPGIYIIRAGKETHKILVK